MPSISKIFRNEVRETSLSNHLPHRSTHKSAPLKGLTHQPQTERVEVHFYG